MKSTPLLKLSHRQHIIKAELLRAQKELDGINAEIRQRILEGETTGFSAHDHSLFYPTTPAAITEALRSLWTDFTWYLTQPVLFLHDIRMTFGEGDGDCGEPPEDRHSYCGTVGWIEGTDIPFDPKEEESRCFKLPITWLVTAKAENASHGYPFDPRGLTYLHRGQYRMSCDRHLPQLRNPLRINGGERSCSLTLFVGSDAIEGFFRNPGSFAQWIPDEPRLRALIEMKIRRLLAALAHPIESDPK